MRSSSARRRSPTSRRARRSRWRRSSRPARWSRSKYRRPVESEGDMDSATFRTLAQAAVAAAVVAWGAALVAAGEQAPDPAASVFTLKQAADGKAAYAK